MVALLKNPKSAQFSPDTYADRRIFERTAAHAHAVGHRLDHTIGARQNPRLTLNLRDVSLGGLAAVADRPVQQGEHLSVSVPRRGLIPGWDACGRVLRCSTSPMGYEVAIEFEPLLAA